MVRATTARPPDRRQRRSRTACRNALLELIRDVPYDTITVDQITDRADIGRATFYAHYTDKSDLLRELSDELVSEAALRARLQDRGGAAYSGYAAAEILRHAGEHAALYRLVISGAGGARPRAQLVATLSAAVSDIFTGVSKAAKRKPALPMQITASAFTGALLAVTQAWLDGEIKGTPTEVAATFMHGQVEGLRWALGLAPDAMPFEPPS